MFKFCSDGSNWFTPDHQLARRGFVVFDEMFIQAAYYSINRVQLRNKLHNNNEYDAFILCPVSLWKWLSRRTKKLVCWFSLIFFCIVFPWSFHFSSHLDRAVWIFTTSTVAIDARLFVLKTFAASAFDTFFAASLAFLINFSIRCSSTRAYVSRRPNIVVAANSVASAHHAALTSL